jgi:hypothetical protein
MIAMTLDEKWIITNNRSCEFLFEKLLAIARIHGIKTSAQIICTEQKWLDESVQIR